MELLEIKEGRAFVTLEPMDCVMLDTICSMALGELGSADDAHMAAITRTYATALKSLGMAVVGPGFVSKPNIVAWQRSMDDLGLMPLLQDSEPVLMSRH